MYNEMHKVLMNRIGCNQINDFVSFLIGSACSAQTGGLYAKVNKKVSNFRSGAVGVGMNGTTAMPMTKRESPDEGIQDDVSTDV